MDWSPQSKQIEALTRLENEILYGGARGGGKTDCGQAWLLYDVANPLYRALVLRRNADDLKDWCDRAVRMYSRCNAISLAGGREFRFPSGAVIRTGHLKDEGAYTKYQGHEYQKMLIEEITHIPREGDYEKLLGSCRSTCGISPQLFATTNPDGPGYKWVKKRWNIPDLPTELVISRDEATHRSRVFIPSRAEDNKVLMEADPGYVKYLESIQDDDLREAWLNGSWAGTSPAGAYYKKQIELARAEKRIGIVPYDPMLPVHTWWDLGMSDSMAIVFAQQLGKEWRFIDYYEASGEGFEFYAKVLQDKGYIYGNHYAPHDIQVRELGTGKSRLEVARSLGIGFLLIPNLPIDDGINSVRMRFGSLWIDEAKCAVLIEALSSYQKEWNDKMGEWKAQPLHNWASHAADAVRYWAVTNYQPKKSNVTQYVPQYKSYQDARRGIGKSPSSPYIGR